MPTAQLEQLRKRLRQDFGFHQFRPGQAKACQSALEGRDTLVLMATGSGKSLCYQLPGLELEGTTVIVSPLIALAEDQARHLKEIGRTAVILNSAQDAKKIRDAHREIKAGEVEFVFTTPERLQQTDICDVLAEVGVDMLVIDEAHCVSQWGHDFRPDYLSLQYARKRLGNPPLLAMTATASERTVEDICHSLRMVDPNIVTTGVARPNLRLSIRHCSGFDEKTQALRELLKAREDGMPREPAIIYCATVKNVDRLAEELSDLDAPVLRYHGRLRQAERMAAQEAFTNGPACVMVATNAFGLGIDKADIRQVIHFDIPGSIEAYYQELGRAGRDGAAAECTLLFDSKDIQLQKMFAGGCLDSSQLMTAHHTLRLAVERWGDASGSVALKQICEISPLGRASLKQALQLLAARGLVAPAGRGSWTCVVDEVNHDVMDRLADRVKARAEDRQVALRQLVEFAESPSCRWSQILNYFDDDAEVPNGSCRCDNCPVPTSLVA